MKQVMANVRSAPLSPTAFAQTTRKLVEDVVAPAAKKANAKALSEAVQQDLYAHRDQPDVKLVLDNIKPIADNSRRAVPLKDLYDITEQKALSSATAAATTSGGELTPESARFLPPELRAEFEQIAGVKIDDHIGGMPGVTIKQDGNKTSVDIEFAKALQGQTADKLVIGQADQFLIVAKKLDPVQDPNIPPYEIYITPRDGKVANGTRIQSDTGNSAFSGPDIGHLIFAGKGEQKLLDGSDKTLATLSFNLDKVNGYGTATKAPSAKTQGARESWEKLIDENGQVDFSEAVKAGTLKTLDHDALTALPGAKTMLSAIRSQWNEGITHMMKGGRLEAVRDPAAKTVGLWAHPEEESGGNLYVLDEKSGKWIGTWDVGDDGTKQWLER
jgi:hypothetical protein